MEEEKKNEITDEEFENILDDFFNAFKNLSPETVEKMSENINKMEDSENK